MKIDMEKYLRARAKRKGIDLDRFNRPFTEADEATAKDKEEVKKRIEDKNNTNDEVEDYKESKNAKKKEKEKISEFCANLKSSLLEECVRVPFDMSAKLAGMNDRQIKLGHSIITKMVLEENADVLLTDMLYKNRVCCEYAEAVFESYDRIIRNNIIINEENKKQVENKDDISYVYTVGTEDINKFIDSINGATPEKLATIINNRVENDVQKFIEDEKDKKDAIQNIYDNAKKKIAAVATSEAVVEEYKMKAKRKVSGIYNESKTNLYGYLCEKFSKEVVNSDELKKVYLNESGTLNVARIFNDARVLCTVLETFNTLGIKDIDKKYIEEKILK